MAGAATLASAVNSTSEVASGAYCAALIEGVGFALDSPLEEDGFELQVPLFEKLYRVVEGKCRSISWAAPLSADPVARR